MEASEQPGWRRGFWALIVTQFQGAFSDNALKTLVTFIGLNMAISEGLHRSLVPLGTGLFSLPFILFSMTGGFLADRFSKRTVTIGVKIFEIGIMTFVTGAFLSRNLWLSLGGIFLMGTHSALFGPSKYGLLPELLPEKRLSWGNGILELGTFLAIVLGAAAGGLLFTLFKPNHWHSGALLIGLALAGLATSLGISKIPAAAPTRTYRLNFLGDLLGQIRLMRADKVLWIACLGSIFFNFIGQLALQSIIDLGDRMKFGETNTSLLVVALAVGIGVGSFAAGYLSGGKIEYGLVPLGAIGLTTFSALLARGGLSYGNLRLLLALLGFSGGFFIVPVAALLQHRPSREQRGAVLAASNLLSFVGIFLAAGVYWAFVTPLKFTPQQIFALTAALTLAGTIYVVWLLPDSLMRLLLWMLTHTFYRVRIDGRDNIPERGGALFVCNHVSFVDALLVQAATDRPLRCIMFKDIYEHPLVKPFAKIARHIPISAAQRPREMIKSLRIASDAIRAGEVIVIFAEGQITRIGQLLPFRRGLERIMNDVDAPIIPVNLDGVWGSIFSFERGRFLGKLPHRIPYPVTVSFGKPMPPTSTPVEVRQAVQDLQADAWHHRKPRMHTLHRAFVSTARRHPFLFAMADARVPKLTFGGALTKSVFLARRLKPVWEGQEMVGVLLPPSVAGALVNYAAMLMAKVPVNLNYTASDEVLASCARQCNITTVVTSRAFLEKVKLTVPGKTILLEDVAANPGFGEKLVAALMTWTLPVNIFEQVLGRPRRVTPDDLATVIFSSGSTGDPKGVMLTHYNVGSNIQQLGQTFAFTHRDCILGVLPFFHSFGFTATLMLPPALGVGVVYHASPVDAKVIGELAQKYRVSFLLATPTFLQMYTRGVEPEQFGSLQFVLAGAEKLHERIAQAFEDRFGIRPVEGYGATECSPAVAVSTHDFRAAGFRQVGAKRGKIGHPLPGISVRIADPDSLAPLPLGATGMMLVRGPNVMKGYLGKPEKTAEVLKDGWYVTGDVAQLDADGFLQITDRLTRFSKIGGEMVPHIKVEEKLHELAGASEQTFAVTGVPDEKKGERLVVLHTLPEEKLKPVLEQFAACDLPNLWKPRSDQFVHVDKLPYLGTGKLDLRKVREIAEEKIGASEGI